MATVMNGAISTKGAMIATAIEYAKLIEGVEP